MQSLRERSLHNATQPSTVPHMAHLHRDAVHGNPILDSIHEDAFTVDHPWRITAFNRATERITGPSNFVLPTRGPVPR